MQARGCLHCNLTSVPALQVAMPRIGTLYSLKSWVASNITTLYIKAPRRDIDTCHKPIATSSYLVPQTAYSHSTQLHVRGSVAEEKFAWKEES